MYGENSTYVIIAIFGNLLIVTIFLTSLIKDKNFQFVTLSTTLLIFSLLLGLRSEYVVLDTPKYIEIFKNASFDTFFSNYIFEPIFISISILVRKTIFFYNFYLSTLTFLHLIFIYIAYRMIIGRQLSLIALSIYLSTFTFWLSNLSMLRQGLAIAIFTLAISFLLKNNIKMFVVFSTITALTHFSGAILWIVALLYNFFSKFLKKTYYIYIFSLVTILLIFYPHSIFYELLKNLFSLLPSESIFGKIYSYLIWSKKIEWNVKHVYFLIIILFILSLSFLKRLKKLCYLREMFLLIFISLIIIIIFKHDEMIADRLFMYFVPIIPLFIVNFYKLFNKVDKIIFFAIIFIFTLLWFNVKLLLLQYPGWFIYPYPSVR